MAELKPCPFCGNTARAEQSDYNDKWFVYCSFNPQHSVGHFDGQGKYDTNSEAITAWNTRAAEPEARALTLDEIKARTSNPIWISLGGSVYRCGVVGEKRVKEHETRFVVGFIYGWEWLEDVFSDGKIFDQPPKGE